MFGNSTQRKHWTFATTDPEILKKIRLATYNEFVVHFAPLFAKQADDVNFFLTFEEEQHVVSLYEQHMSVFCKKFRPPLPPNVIGTAFHYYKRFYLNNCAMNYHPKDMYPICVFLACKIDEFNLSIDEFVLNFESKHRPRMVELIINNEFLLICSLKFHLTIHNPYRPVKGILIDLEMKRPDLINSPFDQTMPIIKEFLEKVFLTNAIFFYAPSQIALAAIIHSLSKKGMSIDAYVSTCLIPKEKIETVAAAVKGIRQMVKRFKFTTTPDQIAEIGRKLEECRNQENNIDSRMYRKPMDIEESLEDDDSFDS